MNRLGMMVDLSVSLVFVDYFICLRNPLTTFLTVLNTVLLKAHLYLVIKHNFSYLIISTCPLRQ